LCDTLAAEGMRPVAGGTDTHLALIDLRGSGVTGAEAERRCAEVGITLNRNVIPYDPEPPTITSGIRVGTPCATTQGMGPEELKEVGSLVARAVRNRESTNVTRARVSSIVAIHQPYPSDL
ncbi:MAG: serine hydroxymethyltransferase, partial [Thermoactinospora sp.]|nr:serine hydroxymethyltransferase [Thermoactinospora sp.]